MMENNVGMIVFDLAVAQRNSALLTLRLLIRCDVHVTLGCLLPLWIFVRSKPKSIGLGPRKASPLVIVERLDFEPKTLNPKP